LTRDEPPERAPTATRPTVVVVMLGGLAAVALAFVPIAAKVSGSAVVIPLLAAVVLFSGIMVVAWRGHIGSVPHLMMTAYLASLVLGVVAVRRVDNGPEFVCVAIVFAGLTLRMRNVVLSLVVAWAALGVFYIVATEGAVATVSETSLILYSGLLCALLAAVTAFNARQASVALTAEAEARNRSEVMADRLQELNASLAQQVERRTAELRRAVAEQDHLLEQLRVQSVRDPLTRLFNRGYLDAELGRLLAASRRSNEPLVFALIDLDGFKAVNDTLGHQAGDHVLLRASEILARTVREEDVAARYGGDELALILPGTQLVDAIRVCERVRGAIEDEPWEQIGSSCSVTVSIGLSESRGCADPQTLIASADRCLYTAKSEGRNRTVPTL